MNQQYLKHNEILLSEITQTPTTVDITVRNRNRNMFEFLQQHLAIASQDIISPAATTPATNTTNTPKVISTVETHKNNNSTNHNFCTQSFSNFEKNSKPAQTLRALKTWLLITMTNDTSKNARNTSQIISNHDIISSPKSQTKSSTVVSKMKILKKLIMRNRVEVWLILVTILN